MQNEKDSDDLGSDEAERCPICGKPTQPDVCEHLLGAFDITFPGEGQYGIGLVGGALYEVAEIGDVFNAARLDYAKARISGKSRTAAVPGWCKEDRGLKQYLTSLGKTDVDLAPSDYTDVPKDTEVQDHASFLAGEGSADAISALSSWLESVGTRVMETSGTYDNPMMSSDYESWWCHPPEDAVAKLTDRLRQMLEKRDRSQA